jgi:hypothetical protein
MALTNGVVEFALLPTAIATHVNQCSACRETMAHLNAESDLSATEELDVIAAAVRQAQAVQSQSTVRRTGVGEAIRDATAGLGQRVRFVFSQLSAAMSPPQFVPTMRSAGTNDPIRRRELLPGGNLSLHVQAMPEALGYRVFLNLTENEGDALYGGAWQVRLSLGSTMLQVELLDTGYRALRPLRRAQLDELVIEILFPDAS